MAEQYQEKGHYWQGPDAAKKGGYWAAQKEWICLYGLTTEGDLCHDLSGIRNWAEARLRARKETANQLLRNTSPQSLRALTA